MSRNGPIGVAGMRPPARRPLADDPAAQWPPQYIEPQHQQGAYAQQPAHAQQQGHGHPPSYGQQPAYAQPQHAQPPGYGQPQPHGQQPSQGYYFPQATGEPEPAAGYAPQAGGHQLPFESPVQAAPNYAPQAQHPQAAQRWGQQADPRGYDLGNYMPTAQGYQPAEAAHYQPAPEPVPLQHHSDFDGAALPRQHDPARFDPQQQGYGESDSDFDEILEDEDEPRRGRRGLMIVAALVGAIGLGGALAYTYKTFVASSGGKAPIIKAADFGPNKVKPVVQDGKTFANTDKKLLNRLGEDGNTTGRIAVGVPPPNMPAADDRANDDPNSPRKVKILPITPSGPPQGAAPVTTASNPPMVAVPGMMVDTPLPPPSAARAALPPPQAPARVAPQPPVKMASAAKAEPPMMQAEPAAPARKPAPVAKQAVAKTPVPKVKTAAAPEASATSGYVAVLSSKKSRMDALKAFADIQQKYGDVLASKTPDVQEANLGEKGIWYRAVVGPPGSRDAATGLCSKLKTAGYNGCWVTAY
jgi:hypothetical protein